MKLLKELLNMSENSGLASAGPVDLGDVIRYFPSKSEKAINALAKSGRLTFGGLQAFDDGEYGQAIKQAIQTAEEYLKGGNATIDVDVHIEGTVDGRYEDEYETTDYPIDDFEQVAVGYTLAGNIAVGYDFFLDENIFNDDWDSQFLVVFGTRFDLENPEHREVFNKAWAKWKDTAYRSVMIEIDNTFRQTNLQTYDGPFHDAIRNREFRAFKQFNLNWIGTKNV